MLKHFEDHKDKDDKYRLANIILLQVPHTSHQEGKGHDENQVIGAYVSDGWY